MADVVTSSKNDVNVAQPETTYGTRHVTPRVDILETDKELLLFAEMPGVRPDDVELRYENGELVLHGKVQPKADNRPMLLNEYEESDFYRVFRIDETIDPSKIEAECKNGVLTVHLPKTEAVRPRQIAVKTAYIGIACGLAGCLSSRILLALRLSEEKVGQVADLPIFRLVGALLHLFSVPSKPQAAEFDFTSDCNFCLATNLRTFDNPVRFRTSRSTVAKGSVRMMWCRWFLPLLSLVLTAANAPGQGIIVYNPYLSGSSVTYSTHVGKHGSLTISAGTLGVPGYGYLVPPPRYSYSSSLNIYTISPPVIVVPRESLYGPDDDYGRTPPSRRDGGRRELPPPEADPAPMDRPLPGRDAGDFRPLDPDNRKRAEQPIQPEPPKKPFVPPEDKLLPLPGPPQPEANPVAESARLVGLGKTAFAEQQYGLAAERFLQASQLKPNDALPHFLHAQALLALGKYLNAVDAINSGMGLQPDWPLKRFQPLELYGQHVAAYPEHLRRLEDTLAKHPNDAALLFLSAYQLWFDGRKDEARVLFQRARPGVPDPSIVDRFLQAKPAAPVASGEAPPRATGYRARMNVEYAETCNRLGKKSPCPAARQTRALRFLDSVSRSSSPASARRPLRSCG